jgi:hypothetical protein
MSKLPIFIIVLLSSSIQAAPLLEKITTPGFVMPEYAISKKCTLQTNGTVSINYTLATLTAKKTFPVQISVPAINTLINQAAIGKLIEGQSIADTGRVEYVAYQAKSGGIAKQIILWQAGEIAPKTNDSSQARVLRNFIDLVCGDPLFN